MREAQDGSSGNGQPITAHVFALQDSGDHRHLGFGLLVLEARYASVLWSGHAQIQRRHLGPRGWLEVEREIRTLTLGLLDPSTALHSALVPSGRGVRLSYAIGRPIMSGDPGDLVAALDALLLEIAAAR